MSKLSTLKHYIDLTTSKNKTAYIGWVGHANLGDEILFDAHKELFPNRNLKFYLRSNLLDRFLPNANKFDNAFLGGGTLINQANVWLDSLHELKAQGTQLACFGTGVACRNFWTSNDSWKWQDNLDKWAEILKEFSYVGVRGPRSKAYLDSVGVECEIIGDTAITLAQDSFKKISKLAKSPVVGFNVGYAKAKMWGDEQDFIKRSDEIVDSLIKAGFKVKLLPVWDADLNVNVQLFDKYSHTGSITLVKSWNVYEQYSRDISECDFFIGEKLHATIIATLHRIPSIMFEYRPKCAEYMESIEMQDYCMRTDKVTSDNTMTLLNQLIENRVEVQNNINDRVTYYKNLQRTRAQSLFK